MNQAGNWSVLSRRGFLKATGLMAGAAILAACTPVQAPSSGSAAAPGAEKVELQWWSFALGLPPDLFPHGKQEQAWADQYMKLHPEVTITYQAMGWDALAKMATAITAGTPPNLILRGGIDQLLYAFEGDVAL